MMLKQNQRKMENEHVQISINKEPSFTEIWYEGSVEYNGETHQFWLIHPKGVDPHGNEYELDVRWFFVFISIFIF